MTTSIMESLSDKSSLTTGKGLVRAQEILLTAQALFVAEGYAGLSMRGVASRLNISLSTVQHYYKSKEALLEALLAYMLDGYQHLIAELAQSMTEKTPLERFVATMDMLMVEIKQPETYGVFTETWAMAQRMPFAAQLVEKIQLRERKEIFKLIYGLDNGLSAEECKLRAALIIVQLHGVMLHFPREGDASMSRQHLEEAARQSFLRLATMP
jgi:AcrR family transcriptional regulator